MTFQLSVTSSLVTKSISWRLVNIEGEPTKVRLDRWRWAARFVKTRSKAKDAVDGGKVHMDGARCKPGKELRIGDQLLIRQGWEEKTIIVQHLSEQRRGAELAQMLYQETPESTTRRELILDQRRAAGQLVSNSKPDKKTRRLIHQFQNRNLNSSD